MADVEQYDKICKVEPFQRGLKTLNTDVMINGRRRDHGAERAYIDIAEVAPIGGGLAKLNPLAYWTLEDCFDYAAANGVPLHPTVALGYPSQGDEKDAVPVRTPMVCRASGCGWFGKIRRREVDGRQGHLARLR